MTLVSSYGEEHEPSPNRLQRARCDHPETDSEESQPTLLLREPMQVSEDDGEGIEFEVEDSQKTGDPEVQKDSHRLL